LLRIGFAAGRQLRRGSFSRIFLITEEVLLIRFNCPQVSSWVSPIMQPVFDEFEIVADTAAVNPYPVKSFDPLAVESVFFEGAAAEIQAFGCLSFADEEKHDGHD
jgi:hypothetical protein